MTRDTDRDWATVAEHNPYWAVLSDDRLLATEVDEAGVAPVIVYPTGDHTGHMGVHPFMRQPG